MKWSSFGHAPEIWDLSNAPLPSTAGPSFQSQVSSAQKLAVARSKTRNGRWPVDRTEFDQKMPRLEGLLVNKVRSQFQEELQIWVNSPDCSDAFETPLRKQLKKCFGRQVEPSLTIKELIALAILSTHNRVASRMYIYKWICTTFPHFLHELLEESIEEYLSSSRFRSYMVFRDVLFHVLDVQEQKYDVDFPPYTMPERSRGGEKVQKDSYALPPGAESRLFERWYPKAVPAQGRPEATLLGLPAELKVKILRLLLRFPHDRWLVIQEVARGYRQVVHTISVSVPGSKLPNFTGQSEGLGPTQVEKLPSPKKFFAPLVINREFHGLATEIFFGENRFACYNGNSEHGIFANITGHFLRGIGPKNRRFIRFFKFNFIINKNLKAREMKETIVFLGQSERLKEIEMEVIELKLPKHYLKDIKKTYGYAELRSFRGLDEAKFHGICAKTKEYLEAEMLRPKVDRNGPAFQPDPKPKVYRKTTIAPKKGKAKAVPLDKPIIPDSQDWFDYDGSPFRASSTASSLSPIPSDLSTRAMNHSSESSTADFGSERSSVHNPAVALSSGAFRQNGIERYDTAGSSGTSSDPALTSWSAGTQMAHWVSQDRSGTSTSRMMQLAEAAEYVELANRGKYNQTINS